MNEDMKMMSDNSKEMGGGKKSSIGYKILRVVVIIILCASVLGGGAYGAVKLFTTGPRPKMKAPIKKSPLVRVEEISRGTEQVFVKAMGTVIPARQIILKSRVSGEVVSVHPDFSESFRRIRAWTPRMGLLTYARYIRQGDPCERIRWVYPGRENP